MLIEMLIKSKLNQKVYILLSGGQDSFVSLLWAMNNFTDIEAVTINYNQTHENEINYATRIAKIYNIPHYIYNIDNFFKVLSVSSLTGKGDHNLKHPIDSELPASFVPGRNGIFLTILAIHAYTRSVDRLNLIIGVNQVDFSGYPDCRDNYIKAKQLELSLGLNREIIIYTPLIYLSKAEIFLLADEYGKLNELKELTLSCYNGIERLNEWGRGCGNCPACIIRKNGYEEFLKLKKIRDGY